MKEFAIEYILHKLNVKDPKTTYCRIDKFSKLLDNFSYDNYKKNLKKYKISEFGTNKNIPAPIDVKKYMESQKNSQEKIKNISILYKKIVYNFDIYHDSESSHIQLYRPQDKNDKISHSCIHIIVDKKHGKSEIHNLFYDNGCLPSAELNDKSGSTLIKLALLVLDKIKNRYGINSIYLTDNSTKNCRNKKIKLHKMLTLLTGTTWYGKYGFIPSDKLLRQKFIENKKIIDNTYLKDIVQLKDYIIKSYYKSKSSKNLDDLINNYEEALKYNVKLSFYLTYFMKNYDSNCIIFYYFYEKLFDDLKLTTMENQQFIKKIKNI